MQFMSQAMGIADCILLAVAPIGAITTVVSAIRVAGPTWLKSFIGRARENLAAAEVEVMSSTSKETCELWNGHRVVRCPGSADIYQFICLIPNDKTPDNHVTHIPSSNNASSTNSQQTQEIEITIITDNLHDGAPNLLLNCHDRAGRREIYIAAALAIILQLGAVLYFGIITYHKPIQSRFLKDGNSIVKYAFPCAAIGTILLVFGLFICSWVVGESTIETYYETGKHQIFVVWLQKGHTVSDQEFKPYAIYPASKRDYFTISRRQNIENDRKEIRDLYRKPLYWPLNFITVVGSFISLVGFISQFIGMRGLNWTASIVQLGITIVVTVLRVIVRRGLGKTPNRTALKPKFELHWFVLSFGNI
ncbi:hypothetical protein M441DRAFT_113246, partial [Trichoderma asperellum CBS 433.97]